MLPSPSPERARAERGYAARPPWLQAAVVQSGAALLVCMLCALAPGARGGNVDAMAWALAQGIVALRLARGLGMDPWWLPLHALFAPGLVWALARHPPPLFALIAFCLLVSLYAGTLRSRVPLFLSSRAAQDALLGLLPRERSFAFIDVGCGPGGLLARLARERAQGRYEGIEAAPLPYLIARVRALLARGAWQVRFGDYRNLDLCAYDIVYAYLSPAAMPELWRKARAEMRTGSLFVSNSFAVPGVPAAWVAHDAHARARLYVWRM